MLDYFQHFNYFQMIQINNWKYSLNYNFYLITITIKYLLAKEME